MLPFKIAFRFLTYNLRRFFGLFLTIMFGTAIFYFIFVAAKALEEKVIEYSQAGEAALSLTIPLNSLSEEQLIDLENELLKHPDIDGVYPVYQFTLYASKGGLKIVKGIDFENTNTHYYKFLNRRSFGSDPSKEMTDDSNYDFEAATGGAYIRNARKDGNYIPFINDDDVGIILPLTYKSPFGEDKIYNIKMSKIYVTDTFVIRSQVIFVDYNIAKEISGLTMPTNLDISIKNPLISNKVSREIEPIIDKYFDNAFIKDWSLENNDIINIVYVEKISVIIVQIITAFAIAIGLMNVLSFNVKEKIRQIGILKAMGINKSKANSIFVIQTLFVSLISIIVGILFGYGLSYIFQLLTISSNGDNLIWMETNLFNKYTYLTALVMFVFNLFGALMPIIRVNNLEIVEIIKNN